jgi:hypothetical protein
MSTHPDYLFLFCLIVATVVSPALGNQQSNIGIVENSTGVVQNQYNIDAVNGYVAHQDYTDNRKSSETNTYIFETPAQNTLFVNMLGVGDVDTTRLFFKGEAIAYSMDAGTYKITTGSAVAIYTIRTGNDVLLLQDSNSEMIYDRVYHRFDHQLISPAWIYEGYTNKCYVIIENGTYLVIDNRDRHNPFADNTMVNIASVS